MPAMELFLLRKGMCSSLQKDADKVIIHPVRLVGWGLLPAGAGCCCRSAARLLGGGGAAARLLRAGRCCWLLLRAAPTPPAERGVCKLRRPKVKSKTWRCTADHACSRARSAGAKHPDRRVSIHHPARCARAPAAVRAGSGGGCRPRPNRARAKILPLPAHPAGPHGPRTTEGVQSAQILI